MFATKALVSLAQSWQSSNGAETIMPEDKPEPDYHTINKALWLMGIAAFATVAAMRVADPLLPQVANDFNVTAGDASLISSSFTIAYALGQFVYGPLGDRFGKLRVIALMTILSGITVGATGFAHSLETLGYLRFIAGATTAAIVPLAMAFIGDHVDYENRQPVLARFLSSAILGVIFGQAFGGVIGDWFGWRTVFPILGSGLLVTGLLLVFELRNGRLPPPKCNNGLSISSIFSNYRTLLARPWVRVILVVVFVEGIFFYGAFTFIGADLHQRFEISYSKVGLVLCSFGIGGLIYTFWVRWLLTRLGERGMSSAGGLLIATGLIGIMLLPLAVMPMGLLVLGLGLHMLHNTLQTNATQMAPETRGLAVSSFANSLFLGQAVGIYLSGLIVDHTGFSAAYMIAAAGLSFLGIAFSELIRRKAMISRQ